MDFDIDIVEVAGACAWLVIVQGKRGEAIVLASRMRHAPLLAAEDAPTHQLDSTLPFNQPSKGSRRISPPTKSTAGGLEVQRQSELEHKGI